jgi:hypothetical protein
MSTSPPEVASDFHVSIGGVVHGPLEETQARALVSETQGPGAQPQVWRPAWTAWLPASQVWPTTAERGTPTATGGWGGLVLLIGGFVAFGVAVKILGGGIAVAILLFVVFSVVLVRMLTKDRLVVGSSAVAARSPVGESSGRTSSSTIVWRVAVLAILGAVATAYFVDRDRDEKRRQGALEELRRMERERDRAR